MFQSLRQNSQIYVLHKDGLPVMETGTVVSVSMPTPKYQIPQVFGQQQEMVVDIVVQVNGQETTFQKLPASADIADFGTGIVISNNREAMNAEIVSLKRKSIDIINSVDFHKQVIDKCEGLLSGLNPEYAERQHQQAEIADLKAQVAELVKMNKDMMSRLGSGASVE